MKKLYQIIIISVLILIGLLNGVKGQGREREEAIEFGKYILRKPQDIKDIIFLCDKLFLL